MQSRDSRCTDICPTCDIDSYGVESDCKLKCFSESGRNKRRCHSSRKFSCDDFEYEDDEDEDDEDDEDTISDAYSGKKPKKRVRMNDKPVDTHDAEDDDGCQGDVDPQLYVKIETTLLEHNARKETKLNEIVLHPMLKEILNRTIIWPLRKPEIFKGLRSAPKGVLLFGPPGNGKTLIGQCIAFESKSTLFNISSSTLTSKWMGESEKLVRTMFIVAKARQPSVIFIDEVDGILSHRTPDENGSTRRMKNEFLSYMDGCGTVAEDRIMIVGATNRPQELDEAARRRFVKRLYIPLPDEVARKEILQQLLHCECHSLEDVDINDIVRRTEGYSVSDMRNLGQEAAMGPIKILSTKAIIGLKPDKIRPISCEDFLGALELIKPSISKDELKSYEIWDSLYGYGGESIKRWSDILVAKRGRVRDTSGNNPYIT